MRILLFILTNMAVVLVMGVVWRLLGFESILDNQGIDLDFNSLLVFCALFVWKELHCERKLLVALCRRTSTEWRRVRAALRAR